MSRTLEVGLGRLSPDGMLVPMDFVWHCGDGISILISTYSPERDSR